MWKKVTSYSRPSESDENFSRRYAAVRRNIVKISDEGSSQDIYQYEEMKIPRELFDTFRSQSSADERLADIEEAVAEIIGGGLV